MASIKRPIAVAGWVYKGLYSAYLELARENLTNQRTFEAITVSCICLDVLLRHIIDGLLLNHAEKLGGREIAELEILEKGELTAGKIIDRLEQLRILENTLIKALRGLNRIRNRVIHPAGKKGLKGDAIIPPAPAKQIADKIDRYLSLAVRLAGGETPEEDATQEGMTLEILRARKRSRQRAQKRLKPK